MTFYMQILSIAWAPPLGFDHVSFQIFFHNPSNTGATVLPFQNMNFPDGLTWSYEMVAHGWGRNIYNTLNASSTAFGSGVGTPDIMVTRAESKIEFLIYGDSIGSPLSLKGWKLYITTFDIDGTSSTFRRIGFGDASDHRFHSKVSNYFDTNGNYTNALILDSVSLITIP